VAYTDRYAHAPASHAAQLGNQVNSQHTAAAKAVIPTCAARVQAHAYTCWQPASINHNSDRGHDLPPQQQQPEAMLPSQAQNLQPCRNIPVTRASNRHARICCSDLQAPYPPTPTHQHSTTTRTHKSLLRHHSGVKTSPRLLRPQQS
jgi:hypothetical protein